MDQYFCIQFTLNSGGPLSDNVTYTIQPYLGNQNALIAIISAIIQIALLAFCLRLVYRYVKKDEIQELKSSQAKKTDQWESFLDETKDRKGP